MFIRIILSAYQQLCEKNFYKHRFPSGQRGETQDLMRKLRRFKSCPMQIFYFFFLYYSKALIFFIFLVKENKGFEALSLKYKNLFFI